MSQRCDLPDWVENTPDPCTYCLVMYDSLGFSSQNIWVNRSRFLQLKVHLAALRGYRYDEEMAAFRLDPSYSTTDEQQLALALEIAQELFRKYPALVTGKLPERWNRLLDKSHPNYPKCQKEEGKQ